MAPRSFQARLLLLMVGVLVLLQVATLLAVHLAGQRSLRRTIRDELRVGARVFNSTLSARGHQLSDTVRVLAADFAFREAVASGDRPTITSVLNNHGSRIAADAVFLIGLDGSIEADTLGGRFVGRPFPLPALVERARDEGEAAAIVSLDQRQSEFVPFQFVVVPVLAPEPIAWVCIGFTIGEAVLADVRNLTGLDVSLWAAPPGARPLLISALTQDEQAELLERIREQAVTAESLQLGGETYETLLEPLATADGSRINMLLQRSLEQASGPLRQLELQILALSSGALLVAIVAASFFARGVTRPLRRLAEAAQRIGRGDYVTPVGVAQGDEIGQLAAAFDGMRTGISQREEQIRFQASHDALTGLPNRVLFLDRLGLEIAQARRRGSLVGMVMMDLDRFKEINDTLGHNFGDDLLAEVARRLEQARRAGDTVARLGGDEFAVMFEVADARGALEVATRVGRVLDEPITLGGVSIDVKASLGIALCPLHADDAGTLMKRADVAMYQAKRQHGAVAVYEPGRDEHSLRRLAILSELRLAIASDQLELHYQPKVALADGRVRQAEALVRWRHPQYGLMAPDEFVVLAEQSGNVGLITRWVLAKAMAACAEWDRAGLDLAVAVNLSALDLHDPELPAFVSGLLQDCGLSPARLVLEITESAAMKDPAHAQKILGELKERGLALAIDDYGTGQSSLAQLKRLRVDELKIDKSFVVHLGPGASEDALIVRSTIELGHNLGLVVVAEGVEDAAAWELLGRFGCDLAQGYFVSRPLPLPQFREWLEASSWGQGRGAPERA